MIRIKKSDHNLRVEAPYDRAFIRRVKQIGGKWNGTEKVWEVPEKARENLKQLLLERYDYDGRPGPTCSIQVSLPGNQLADNTLTVGPVQAIRKLGRDDTPRLAANAWVVTGELLPSGGSRAYPRITYTKGTVIQIDDFPLFAAERLVAREPSMYQIVELATDTSNDLTHEEALTILRGIQEQLAAREAPDMSFDMQKAADLMQEALKALELE